MKGLLCTVNCKGQQGNGRDLFNPICQYLHRAFRGKSVETRHLLRMLRAGRGGRMSWQPSSCDRAATKLLEKSYEGKVRAIPLT